MNLDLNALTNIVKMLGGLQNTGANEPTNSDMKPRNAANPFDKSKDDNLYGKSPFASQNGLGDKIDAETFSSAGQKQNNTKNDSKSPMESILNLMNKKKDLDKIMPAFASVFANKHAQTACETPVNVKKVDESDANMPNDALKCPKQKENGKSEDLFSPIGFAGYTLVSALNRLYFNSKN